MAITVILNEWTFDEWLDGDDGQWFPYSLLLYPLKTFVGKNVAYSFIAESETYFFTADDTTYYFIAENE